jgi:hypothetical protein
MLYFSTPLAYTQHWYTFIESSIFERIRPAYLDDDEYSELQQFLMQNPEVGELTLAQVAFARRVGHELGWESEAGSASSTMFVMNPMSSGC